MGQPLHVILKLDSVSLIHLLFLLQTPEGGVEKSLKTVSLEFEIPVHQGVIDYESTTLLEFKQHCCLFWGSALSFLEHVANLLKEFAIPSAIIKGKKVIEILSDFELTQRPTKEELLSVLKNYITVKGLISQPGQRYKGPNRAQAAATKIQATWRCYQCRKAYITFRRKQWASGVLAISWLVHIHMRRVRKTLQESRQRHLENFFTRAKVRRVASYFANTFYSTLSAQAATIIFLFPSPT